LYWKVDEFLTWHAMYYVSYWIHSAVGKIVTSGDSLEPYVNESCLLVINHQCDADVFFLMTALRNLEGLRGRLLVVLEDIFHRTYFGIMLGLRGDFFIHQGKDQRHLQASLIENHFRHYENLRDPRWCVLWPEGGFLKKRKQRNVEYARKHGYPILDNVLLPRLGALQALLNAERANRDSDHVITNGDAFHQQPKRLFFRHIIDMTIAYPERKPVTVLDVLLALSPVPKVAVHYRVRKLDQLSASNENQLRTFMYDLWSEKDQLLRDYYENGSFPDEKKQDALEINYMAYVKGYGVTLSVLSFYAFCIWTCLSYLCLLVFWVCKPLINLIY